MRKRRRIDASRREIPLPDPVIQHIQSFLGGKQAARTSVVSKSWYNAWLTRPNLYFNESCFARYQYLRFWDFVKKTVRRYDELNLNINSFKLLLGYFWSYSKSDVDELIEQVLKLCVDGADFKFKFDRNSSYVLTSKVLEDERIVRLSVFGCKIDPPVDGKEEFSRLKSLKLEYMCISDDLFCDTFPCLEDLSLVCCHGYKVLEVSSTSLKCISIVAKRSFEASFNVPNICKFVFSGSSPPLLSLTEASTTWESDLLLKHLHDNLNKSWFFKLKSLLRRLSRSMCKVSLSIGFCGCNDVSYVRLGSSDIPKVENLMLSLSSPFAGYDALFDTLFKTCRPKFITQYWLPKACMEEKANNKLIKFLCKRLMPNGKSLLFRFCVEEVKFEIFDETHTEWRPVLWKTLMNGSTGQENKRKIRFQLEWLRETV